MELRAGFYPNLPNDLRLPICMLQWNMTSSCYYFCTVVLTRNHLFAVRDKAVDHLTRPAKESYQLFGGLERRGGGEVGRCVCGVCVRVHTHLDWFRCILVKLLPLHGD